MDGDLAAKVSALLSDPEMAAKIASIASSLSGGGQSVPASAEQSPELPAAIVKPPSIGDPRLALLASVRPLLREEKRGKLDSLVRAMTLVTVLGGLKKGGG